MSTDNKDTQLQQSCLADVKCRFFAQYLGQEILRWHQWIETTKDSKVDLSIPAIEKSGWFIKLKHLSKITDEDANKIPYKNSNDEIIGYYTAKSLNKNIESIGFYTNEEIDNLRKLGYAVPFMEYSVEDLVSLGWVRLV